MRRLVREEAGFTLIELVVVTFVTVVLLAGLANMFTSGLRTSSTLSSTLASQANSHIALDRLEFETRCSSQATLLSSGAGVALTIPDWCSHASGTVSWCVASGTLTRYTSSNCSGSGQAFATKITSATPFSCIATVGDYPQLQIALTVNFGTTTGTAVSTTDRIAMRNAALTTSTTKACS